MITHKHTQTLITHTNSHTQPKAFLFTFQHSYAVLRVCFMQVDVWTCKSIYFRVCQVDRPP